jgi:polyisoprenoid-binding protein YceI
MRSRFLLAAMGSVVLAGCAAPPVPPAELHAARPSDFPEQAYRQAAKAGHAVFHIDPAASIAVIHVHSGGALARLGHEHVVASHDVTGYVDRSAARADLYVALDRLTVDEPALRQQAHLDANLTEDAIAGTRRNMLTRVLDASRYPFAALQVTAVEGDAAMRMARVRLTLHGVTRMLDVPVALQMSARDYSVSGRFTLRQSEYGIVPLSILGGAVQVADPVDIEFRLRARPIA